MTGIKSEGIVLELPYVGRKYFKTIEEATAYLKEHHNFHKADIPLPFNDKK